MSRISSRHFSHSMPPGSPRFRARSASSTNCCACGMLVSGRPPSHSLQPLASLKARPLPGRVGGLAAMGISALQRGKRGGKRRGHALGRGRCPRGRDGRLVPRRAPTPGPGNGDRPASAGSRASAGAASRFLGSQGSSCRVPATASHGPPPRTPPPSGGCARPRGGRSSRARGVAAPPGGSPGGRARPRPPPGTGHSARGASLPRHGTVHNSWARSGGPQSRTRSMPPRFAFSTNSGIQRSPSRWRAISTTM